MPNLVLWNPAYSKKAANICTLANHHIDTFNGLSSTYKCNFLGADNKQ